MAAIVVNSRVIREKAGTIERSSASISNMYEKMLQNATSTANRMKGSAVETQVKEFADLRNKFKIFNEDMKKYGVFLNNAAAEYEKVEKAGTDAASGMFKGVGR